MPRATKLNNDYISNGVTLKPAVPSIGDTVTVSYDGLLAKSGATHVLAHVGYGNTWSQTGDYKMTRTGNGTSFEATIPVTEADTLNICFKDCANNWDNNAGKNYTFDISK